jgi:DNA-binding transcriptional LysR family regulator
MKDKVKLGQLRAFVEVYRLRKLNAAAVRLCVTQSAVSVLIRQLESAIGTVLFDRTTRSLHPTAAAQEMLPIAERILRDVQTLGSSFGPQATPQGRVAIATTPTIASTLLPPVIRQFNQLHPQVRLVLDDCAPDQFIARIIGEHVDFGIGSPNEAPSEMVQRTLLEDYLCVVCPRGHALTRRRLLRWADLDGIPIVTIKPGYGIRESIDRAATQAGVLLDIQHEVAFLTTALAMSASGVGITILPSSLIAHSGFDNLVARQLDNPRIVRNISVISRRDRTLSVASERFIALLQAQVPTHQGSVALPGSN